MDMDLGGCRFGSASTYDKSKPPPWMQKAHSRSDQQSRTIYVVTQDCMEWEIGKGGVFPMHNCGTLRNIGCHGVHVP